MRELSWKDAIVEVLKDSDEAMHYTDISEAIAERKLKTTFGANPATSVSSTISLSILNERDNSPFVKHTRGYYGLKTRKANVGSAENIKAGETVGEAGLINAFGMYWRRDYVLWNQTPKILGQYQIDSDLVDFSEQKGVYILHSESRVIYVGRTTEQTFGTRLNQHTVDRLNGRWDRFSWFGVLSVSDNATLSKVPPEKFDLEMLIVTMEALLIEGLEPPQNRKRGDQFRAVEFIQVQDPQIKRNDTIELIEKLKKTV